MKSLTLQALRGLVGSTKGQRLPTTKALRESGDEIVASTAIGASGQLAVYQNGFYIYETDIGSTVYAVDRCADYTYEGSDVLPEALFDEESWAVRLLLAGEDRLEHNNDVREQGAHFSYSADTTERGNLRDPHDFVVDLENSDLVEQMMGCLTEKQRRVVWMHIAEGLTHQQIADYLGIARQVVTRRIASAIRKLSKKTFFLE